MLVLDTNTISYYFRGDPQVVARLQAQRPDELGVPAIVEYELRYGLLRLPAEAAEPRLAALAQRHAGEDRAILAARHELYARARQAKPARWSGRTRNWSPIGPVTLNPERDSIVQTHSDDSDRQPLAA